LHRAAASSDGRWFAVAKAPSGRIHLLRLQLPDEPVMPPTAPSSLGLIRQRE
jgi:hypothetical protein